MFPLTNNSLERANRSLKDDYTIHVKLGLAQFLKKNWRKRLAIGQGRKEGALP